MHFKRPDPLRRRSSVVRSRDKYQRIQTATDCAAPLPQARHVAAVFVKFKMICECAQAQRVDLIGHVQLLRTQIGWVAMLMKLTLW